ncbi:MAG TPA: inositol monophosphatase family protein [Solirubrobacteraceae bacterium]
MAVSVDAAELLALAERAARRAGALLAARFEAGRETSVASKSTPTDPVSEADLASQRAIRELLAAERPEDSFLGEEEGADQRGSSGIRWVVDPLDGTVNYLYGIPQWCVSIAAFDEHGALAGVVHDPLHSETFTALRGGRAACNGAELAWRGDLVVELGQSLLATGFAYDPALRARQGELVARLLPQVRDIRRFGSAALDLAWTAIGRHDAFYERGVKLWDTAAGVLVCEAVGLAAADVGGGTLVAQSELLGRLAAIIEADRTSAQGR